MVAVRKRGFALLGGCLPDVLSLSVSKERKMQAVQAPFQMSAPSWSRSHLLSRMRLSVLAMGAEHNTWGFSSREGYIREPFILPMHTAEPG